MTKAILSPYNVDRILKALEAAKRALEGMPIHATTDGVWLNARPDHALKIGGAMLKLEGPEVEVFRRKKEVWDHALSIIESCISEEIYGMKGTK